MDSSLVWRPLWTFFMRFSCGHSAIRAVASVVLLSVVPLQSSDKAGKEACSQSCYR